jgi:hypothetical protein
MRKKARENARKEQKKSNENKSKKQLDDSVFFYQYQVE